MSRLTSTISRHKVELAVWLALIATGLLVLSRGSGLGLSGSDDSLRSLGAIGAAVARIGGGAIGGGLIQRAGSAIGRLIGRGGAGTGIGANTTTRAIMPYTGGGGALQRITRAAAGGTAFGGALELGSRLIPGGSPFPGIPGLPGSGGGGGMSSPAANIPGVGQPFGDTFITRMWQSGETAEGVPILHGMLANGKRFATNRYGAIKVFRPRKNIVIGPDPKLSDARKVARAARKMDSAAKDILKVTGYKAVRRG